MGLELVVDRCMQDLGIGVRSLIPPRANHKRGRRHELTGVNSPKKRSYFTLECPSSSSLSQYSRMPPSCGLSRMPPSYDSWVNAQVDLMKPVWLTLIPNVFIKSHTHPNDNAHPVPAKHYAYIH